MALPSGFSLFYTHRSSGSAILTCQRPLQWTPIPDRRSTAIALQQLVGAPGQHSSDFSALASDPWNHHTIVAGCLVAHPGDHGGFGSLFDRDALGPSYGAAPDRRGMIGDGPCHLFGEIGVIP